MEAGTSGFVSISDSDRRVPAELGQESQASSCKEEWNSACLSSYSRGDRQLVELCLESAGFSGRCTRVSVPLCVVPSSTGLPLKRCPGIGFLSRADRGIGVFQHVLPTHEATSQIFSLDRPHPEVRREGWEPLPDKARESTLQSQSGGEKWLR